MIDFYNEITSRYGNIKRARGVYLYTEKNIRLTDMYLDGGMSFFGRKTHQGSLVFKQFIDKGLTAFLPSNADYNLKKALNILFPNHTNIKIYTDYENVIKILQDYEKIDCIEDILWRPFSENNIYLEKKDCFFILPPSCSIYKIFVYKDNLKDKFPKSSLIPSAEKASLAKSLFYLISKIKNNEYIDGYQDEIKNLAEKFWHVKNSYLYPKIEEDKYYEFFIKALENKVLISPNFKTPSILPRMRHYTEILNFLNQ